MILIFPIYAAEIVWPAVSATVAFVAMIFTILFSTWNVLGKWISSSYLKPEFNLGVNEIAVHSSLHEGVFHLRIPITNLDALRPRDAATEVEVQVISVVKESGEFDFQRSAFLPIRLNWCHGLGPVCDRISKGSTKLLDLGRLESTIRQEHGMSDRIGARLGDTNPIRLLFASEVSPSEGFFLLTGTYRIKLRISCDQTSTEQTFRFSILPELLEDALPLLSYLRVVSC